MTIVRRTIRHSAIAVIVALAALLSACGSSGDPNDKPAWGHADSGDIHVVDGWVKAVSMTDAEMNAPGGMSDMKSAAYLTINNAGPADALIAVSSPAATESQLHKTVQNDGGSSGTMMRVDSFDVPAGGQLVLTPGGNHIMLLNLKGHLTPGMTVPLTLTFRSGKVMTVSMPVIDAKDRPNQ